MRSLQNQIGVCARVQWVLAIAAAVAVLAFYVLGYRPATQRLAAIRAQIESKERELSQNQTRAENLPKLAKEVRQLESLVQSYDRQFPRQPELGQLIRDMTQISQQLALQAWRYEPGATRRGDSFYELPIQMHFEGDFVNVASFLRQVEGMPRLTRVSKVNVRGKDGKNGQVEVEMAMNIYFSEG